MRNLFMMFAVSVVFMVTDASAATALPPFNTNDVSPSWVASGSREVMYASSSVRHVFEVNVPNFKTEVLCNDFIADQQALAIAQSSRGNLGTQVFSATCSKQR
jgi:hypothetical protein